jgi:hypothetical protein
MLGLAVPAVPAAPPVKAAPGATAEAKSDPTVPLHASKGAAVRTMLGMPTAAAPSAKSQTSKTLRKLKKPVIPAVTDRTVLGMAAIAAQGPGAEEDADASDAEDGDDEPIDTPLDTGPAKLRLIATVAGSIVLVAGALWLLRGKAPAAEARVIPGASGDALEISLPQGTAATQIAFADKVIPVAEGRARFELAEGTLHLGRNDLSIRIIDAAGEATETQLALEVDYRAHFDLAGLSGVVPSADLVIATLPGSVVTVEGKPLVLDAQGRGKQSIRVAASGADAQPLGVRYHVEPAGKPAVDAELKALLPSAQVTLESPLDGLMTDADHVIIRGSAAPATAVSVNGQEAPVQGGHFRARLALDAFGNHQIAIVARAAGRAPRAISVHAERVASLAAAAASYEADSSVTYTALRADAEGLAGKQAAFDGRVYHVQEHAGHTVLQLLVVDCPRGERCPLWVELGELTEVAKDSQVRVLGTILGKQQFVSKQGAVQTVPSLRAAFVLKRSSR